MRINERLMTFKIQLVKITCHHYQRLYIKFGCWRWDKKKFYSKLDNILSSTPKEVDIILSGEFNSRVRKDLRLWNGTIGKKEVSNINACGTLLTTKCVKLNLVITNSLFCQRNIYKISWRQTRFKHCHRSIPTSTICIQNERPHWCQRMLVRPSSHLINYENEDQAQKKTSKHKKISSRISMLITFKRKISTKTSSRNF